MLKDYAGKTSMMRVSLAISLLMGCTLILSGIYIVLQQLNDGVALVNVGAGLMSVGGIVKAFQSSSENKREY